MMARLKARMVLHLVTADGISACGRVVQFDALTIHPGAVTCKNCKRHLQREKRLREAFGPEAVRLLERR